MAGALLVGVGQTALGEHVPLHRTLELRLRWLAEFTEERVKGEELVDVAMAAGRRARSVVSSSAPIVLALAGARGQDAAFVQAHRRGRNVVDNPVNPGALGRL